MRNRVVAPPVMVCVVLMLAGCAARTVTVKSGEEVVCSNCGRAISSDVTTKQVPEQEAPQYSVRTVTKLCSDCETKAQEQERAGERRRAEEERRRLTGGLVGGWVWETAITNIVMKISADGTGTFCGDPFTWQSTGAGAFNAVVHTVDNWGSGRPATYEFSGQLGTSPDRLYVSGYGAFGFQRNTSTTFKRM